MTIGRGVTRSGLKIHHLPLCLEYTNYDLSLIANVQRTVSPFDGSIQTNGLPGDRWSSALAIPPRFFGESSDRECISRYQLFMALQQGGAGRYFFRDLCWNNQGTLNNTNGHVLIGDTDDFSVPYWSQTNDSIDVTPDQMINNHANSLLEFGSTDFIFSEPVWLEAGTHYMEYYASPNGGSNNTISAYVLYPDSSSSSSSTLVTTNDQEIIQSVPAQTGYHRFGFTAAAGTDVFVRDLKVRKWPVFLSSAASAGDMSVTTFQTGTGDKTLVSGDRIQIADQMLIVTEDTGALTNPSTIKFYPPLRNDVASGQEVVYGGAVGCTMALSEEDQNAWSVGGANIYTGMSITGMEAIE